MTTATSPWLPSCVCPRRAVSLLVLASALMSNHAVGQQPVIQDTTTVTSYEVTGDLESTAEAFRRRINDPRNVNILADKRTGRLIVRAPRRVHQQIKAELQRTQQQRPMQRTPLSSPTSVTSSTSTAIRGKLRRISWRQLIAAAQSMSDNRLVLTPTEDGQRLNVTLPSPRGTTSMLIDPDTKDYVLSGKPRLIHAWQRAIDVLELDQGEEAETTQLFPIGGASPQAVERAAQLLQQAHDAARRAESSWRPGDVVGIKPPAQRKPVQLAQAPTPQQPDDDARRQESEDVGVDGSLVGPGPVIEYVEGLDAIIIRGRRQDVERIMRIVGDIERLTTETQPVIELVPLQHVNSQSIADMVTQLNAEALALRVGNVSITPLIKPNALLLIGREEGVKSTIDLISRLDQPVAPSSQFNIFRLKHIPATDARQTLEVFFADRGGLGPRIQLQADFRTNSLIVYASPRDMAEVTQLLREIDVADAAATSEVRVFKLNNALAEELAPVLEATLRGDLADGASGTGLGGGQTPAIPGQTTTAQGSNAGRSARSSTLTMTRIDAQGKKILKSGILTEVRVAADVRANSLVVTAPAESMELIAALVKQLDELPKSEAQIKVFGIVNGDAVVLVEMLNELFGQSSQTQQGPAAQSASASGESSLVPLRFSTDARTNSIIATGSAADLAVVEAVLLRLDERDRSKRQSRVYRLLNAPAQSVADSISQFLLTRRQLQQEIAPDTISPFAQIEREVILVPELVSNSLIMSATPDYFAEIEQLIKELDEQPPMVLIQVLIAEVDLQNTEELGVELGIQDSLLFDRGVVTDVVSPGFNFNNQALGNSSSAQSLATRENTAGQALSSFALGRTNSQLGYGGLVMSASSESVSVLIRALQESRRLDVLSRPQVMTLNNQPAFILVGQRVPRIQSTSQNTFGTVNNTILENVGLLIGVTPRISPDGLVVMEIDAEKSDLGPEEEGIPISINLNGDVIRSPIINATVAQTTVSARSGQTVILGGLITKNSSTVSRSVPFLGDLPVLGQLFRFDGSVDQRTELLIIMTPYIVNKAEDAEWMNQVESQRMSWCLADVVSMHGDMGLGSSDQTGSEVPTEVIYPDQNPTVPPAAGETIRQGTTSQPQQIPFAPLPQAASPQEAMMPVTRTRSTAERTQRDPLFGHRPARAARQNEDVETQPADSGDVSPVQFIRPVNGRQPTSDEKNRSWTVNPRRLPLGN